LTPPIRRTFPGRHDQVACARDFVRRMAGCCPVLDDAVLLTSELCTNALQHTASANGGSFEVTVYHGHDSLRVEVRDDGAKAEPVIQAIENMQENGRGLEIVALIAHRWGQRGDEYGRTVFFELRWNYSDGRPYDQPSEA
jgi:anti-sigma regulatory factor (Ser/Thr protein kinase)